MRSVSEIRRVHDAAERRIHPEEQFAERMHRIILRLSVDGRWRRTILAILASKSGREKQIGKRNADAKTKKEIGTPFQMSRRPSEKGTCGSC
jgi:hypothetical protein